MTEPIIYVNGDFVPQSQARISVLDHAVLYGDGIFETACAWNGRIFKLDAHIERGFRSMAAIALTSPVDRDEMRRLILETVRRNRLDNAYIKWIVTRGVNGKPLMDPAGCSPNLIILAQPYIQRAAQERLASGLRLKTVAVRRPGGDILDPRIKSLNYLNLVLAKLEAKAAGADEALLLDCDGWLSEATGCNIFTLHDRTLRTPRHAILAGITREAVIEIAPQAGLSVEEADLALYDAYTADEVFITSTAGGLLPVTEIDGRTIGRGTPGPAVAALRAAYDALIASPRYGTPIAGEISCAPS
jgi:branched-chain amino acid aminotransferase